MGPAQPLIEVETEFLQSLGDVGSIILNMLIAALLGALLAFHPQRLRRSTGVIDWEMRKSQILLCVAASIMVVIIEGSLERAFALAGLGAFIRFRTAVRNPLDVALIFVLIAIGMGCGLGYVKFAALATAFIFVLVFVLNVHESRYTERWEIKTQGGTPEESRLAFERLASNQGYRIELLDLNLAKKVFTCRFRPPNTVEVSRMDHVFQGALTSRPDAVVWNRLE